jgi:hypothetical protein
VLSALTSTAGATTGEALVEADEHRNHLHDLV